MNAREILEHLAGRYRGLTRYRDRGDVAVGGTDPESPSTFTTEFNRSEGLAFRFKYSLGVIEVVGAPDGALISTCGLVPEPKTLADAILATKGITFTAGYTVPLMLLPDVVTWRPITATRDACLQPKEESGGESCYVVKLGADWADAEVVVSDVRFLLRSFRIPNLQFTRDMATRAKLAGIHVESSVISAQFSLVVTYDPVVQDDDEPAA